MISDWVVFGADDMLEPGEGYGCCCLTAPNFLVRLATPMVCETVSFEVELRQVVEVEEEVKRRGEETR